MASKAEQFKIRARFQLAKFQICRSIRISLFDKMVLVNPN